MTDEEIEDAFKAQSTKDERGWTRQVELNAANLIGRMIRNRMQITIDQQSVEIAQKDAKIYAYEAIIANSNFKAILPKEGEK